jgi:hypothetical protein
MDFLESLHPDHGFDHANSLSESGKMLTVVLTGMFQVLLSGAAFHLDHFGGEKKLCYG